MENPQPTVTDAAVTALHTGEVRAHRWDGRELETAAEKSPRTGRLFLSGTGFIGDEQGDLKNHGGPDKAVCCYAAENYDAWRAEGRDLGPGAFSENLTLRGATEDRVFLGDTFQVGTALVQVTQPRTPCNTISRRWSDWDLPRDMERTARTGFYLRVLREGHVGAGDAFEFVSRPSGAVSVGDVVRIMAAGTADREAYRGLASAPEFPQQWRRKILRRLGEDGLL
ncbi:MOSC domain-containing protein [Kocuria sp. APC 4018]|uniref:MOSC domain-containing protein n=1 Tax=Kocuria sp. APC 4018 TaxID=3035196 RepID=UPI0025B3A658|nr:MOSC domain-containing protein [Kocuria sp. APC 4018]MDN3461590.1 MOSC domain-containing protein [Kocuria sp. APC 4018]